MKIKIEEIKLFRTTPEGEVTIHLRDGSILNYRKSGKRPYNFQII